MRASYKIAMDNGHSFQLGDCNRGICSNTALCLVVWIDSQGRARCSAQFALACKLGVWDSGRCIENAHSATINEESGALSNLCRRGIRAAIHCAWSMVADAAMDASCRCRCRCRCTPVWFGFDSKLTLGNHQPWTVAQ